MSPPDLPAVFLALTKLVPGSGAEEVRNAARPVAENPTSPEHPCDVPRLTVDIISVREQLEQLPPNDPTRLALLRAVALCAARSLQVGGPERRDWADRDARILAYQWVQFLIDDESSRRNFFLQEFRSRDSTFYDPTRLQPLKRASDDPWCKAMPWMAHAEELTLTELELALCILDWDRSPEERGTSAPRFVWWVRRRPAILWRIHAFLLKRYSFPLLGVFQEALRGTCDAMEGGKPSVLDRPPYRAGEHWRWYPRVGGLTAVGFLGVLSLDQLVAVLFASPIPIAAGVAALGLALLCALVHMDVFKQNRGVMASFRHGLPRVARLVECFLAWAMVMSMTLAVSASVWPAVATSGAMFHRFEGTPFANLLVLSAPIGWRCIARLLVGLTGVTTLSSFLGALLQWFWEDRAATEPI